MGQHPTRLLTLCRDHNAGHKHTSTKLEACFMPEDDLILSGSEDGNLFVWDVASGEQRTSFRAHSDTQTSIALQPEGKLLCTASVDGLVKVWVSEEA